MDVRKTAVQSLKIIVGMGLLWTVEVLVGFTGASGTFGLVVNTLNTLYGVYVFWAFVCTEQIAEMVLGKERVREMLRIKSRIFRSTEQDTSDTTTTNKTESTST